MFNFFLLVQTLNFLYLLFINILAENFPGTLSFLIFEDATLGFEKCTNFGRMFFPNINSAIWKSLMGNISKVNKVPLSARAGPKNVSRKNRNICLFAKTNFGFTLTFRRGKNYFTKFSRKDENKEFRSTSTLSRKGSADPKLSGGGFYRLLSIYCTGRSTQLQNRKSPKLPGEKNRWKAKAKLELG